MRTMALETFKILNKSNPEFIKNIITIKENSYNFRYQNTVDVTRYGKKSFSYKAATLWNSLPNHARSLSTFGQFKIFISDWYFSENCDLLFDASCSLFALNMLFAYVLCLSFISLCFYLCYEILFHDLCRYVCLQNYKMVALCYLSIFNHCTCDACYFCF